MRKITAGSISPPYGAPENCCSTPTCRLHWKRSAAAAAAAAAATACGYGEIPLIFWRFVCCGLEAMWRTNVQNGVSTCVTGLPVPLGEAHARVLWSGHQSERPRTAERVLGLPAEERSDGDQAGSSSSPIEVKDVWCFLFVLDEVSFS